MILSLSSLLPLPLHNIYTRHVPQEVKSEVVEVMEDLAEDADLTEQEQHIVSQSISIRWFLLIPARNTKFVTSKL